MHGSHNWKVGYGLTFCELNYFLNVQRPDYNPLVNSLITYNPSNTSLVPATSKASSRCWVCAGGSIRLPLTLKELLFGGHCLAYCTWDSLSGAFRDKLKHTQTPRYSDK